MNKISVNNILILLILGGFSHIKGQMYPIDGGWIDSVGREIECPECDSTMYSDSQVARYIKNGKWEFVNTAIGTSYSTDYDYLSEFENGFAVVRIKDTWKIIKEDKSVVTTIDCHYAYGVSEGLVRFQLGNRFGYMNIRGQVVLPATYYGAYDFSDGRARVYDGEKWGYIDKSMKVIIPFKYDFSASFSNNRAVVGKVQNGIEKWAVLDVDGAIIYNWSTDYIFPYSEGKALVRQGEYLDSSLKFINTEGQVILSTSIKDCYPFHGGLSCGWSDNKWGYFNEKGINVINYKYDSPVSFKSGMALVSEEGIKKYINRTGDVIWIGK